MKEIAAYFVRRWLSVYHMGKEQGPCVYGNELAQKGFVVLTFDQSRALICRPEFCQPNTGIQHWARINENWIQRRRGVSLSLHGENRSAAFLCIPTGRIYVNGEPENFYENGSIPDAYVELATQADFDNFWVCSNCGGSLFTVYWMTEKGCISKWRSKEIGIWGIRDQNKKYR